MRLYCEEHTNDKSGNNLLPSCLGRDEIYAIRKVKLKDRILDIGDDTNDKRFNYKKQ